MPPAPLAWHGPDRCPATGARSSAPFRDGHTEPGGPPTPSWAGGDPTETSAWSSPPPTRPPCPHSHLVPGHRPAPARRPARAADSPNPPADLTEVVRIYGIRHWIEQSYKQVKDELGWADFQVRSDTAIRRHQTLVTCAFSFCWNTWFTATHPHARRTADHRSLRRRTDREGADPPSHQPHTASWPKAIRAVRGWLTPWATLQRYWRAWTTSPHPPNSKT